MPGSPRSRSEKLGHVASPLREGETAPAEISWIPFSCACLIAPYVDSDDSDSSSENGSDQQTDSETDQDESFDEDISWERINLPLDHKYQSSRSSLVNWIYDQFRVWRTSVRYAIPPGHRQQSRKRARGADRKPRVIYLHDEDPEDPQVVVVSRIDGYFHLACPFYRYNPIRHRRCMYGDDLQSIEEVIIHLQRHHRLPVHCQKCRRTFTDARVRDTHTRGQTCQFQPWITIDGIDSNLMSRILRRDDPYVREDVRWLRIFYRAFSASGRGHSPYLTDGVGLEVSLLRDYLASDGCDLISEHLRRCGVLVGQPEKKALAELQFLTLEDLINRVICDQGVSETGEGAHGGNLDDLVEIS
ncbi:hypothetical protein GQ53DRAFT_823544 [Thozetella sp. PMI_491]|nr:hypothetical protein GQ53DRAFT_823544 [Thozetella sp. PMI_491]